jgi:hypothetical protein
MKKNTLIATVVTVVLAFVVLAGWLHDFITLHGAKTVYTARCIQGEWRGAVCGGRMVAGDRYRFRVLPPHKEVIFWIAGSSEPSGKLAPCAIENAKEWTCSQGPDSSRTITHTMKFGHPVPEPNGPARSYHPVPKWKWLLLDAGVGFLHEADS